MDLFRNDELKDLAAITGDLCISIYMPAHRVGYEQQQDPLRLKNLLDKTEKSLIEDGMRSPDARALLEAARELLQDHDFWQHQSDGLAVFIDPDGTRTYRLPNNFNELVYIGKQFHIKPLLHMISGDGQFFVLAISQNNVRLLQGTRYTVEAVNLDNVPTSMAEALWFEESERQLQWHTSTQAPQGVGERPAAYHGQGAADNDIKESILRYFQRVDRALIDLLQNSNRPLVLAGVDYLLPIYQQANTYPYLVEEGIEGNPDYQNAKELHQRAWEVVEPIFKAKQQNAIAQYEELAGRGSREASNDLEEVVRAAAYGRVETLLVASGVQRWGIYKEDSVVSHDQFHSGDEDLLDLAATYTINNAGAVYVLPVTQVPGNGDLAAIFRYSLEIE
jgi:Bacterial archaeo-eukaryotic release factor family 7